MFRNLAAKAEIAIIILLACVPLLIRFPYRVNIFLSWEGAYRISKGQLPFRDFGVPLGGMYWVIPALFFKLLGAKMITLVKAQVFINILSGLAFRSILKSLSVNKGIRLAGVLLFCISYSFFNFWPWYNHSVIFYELAALAFLFRYIGGKEGSTGAAGPGTGGSVPVGAGNKANSAVWLVLAGVFGCFSFLTKQDGGGMAVLIMGVLVTVHCLYERKWLPLAWYGGAFVVMLGIVILAFRHDGFGYWFNHGQAPHTARVSAFDITEEFLAASQWIKFYFFLTLILVIARYRNKAALLSDKKGVLLVLLTWAILGEAAVFQVTSYTPPDNNIFFHSFAFVCIFCLLSPLLPVNFGKPRIALLVMAGILLWWSGTYWKYMQRVLVKVMPANVATVSPTGENVVNRSTYMINRDTTGEIPMDQWIECGLPSFTRINMPPPTVAGIHRLMAMDMVRGARGMTGVGDTADPVKNTHVGGLRVLNMSELTPLAAEIPYELERNAALPLWFHLGVGMFNRQAAEYEKRIGNHYYDLVLFEYVPNLNNFYPFRVRDSLRVHYQLVDSFMAPRRGDTQGSIEVYIRPK